jgi:peptidoglycan hydrolase-like protein with peptidoglycan-binding domain
VSGRQRIILVIVALGLISSVGLVIAGRRTASATGTASTEATASTSAKTAVVTRTELVDRTTVDGELGYGDTSTIAAPGDGMVTWLPVAGTVVERGQSIARIDEHPLPLLYGTLPLFRDLSAASSDGADIRQLEENLAALGYADGVTVDDHFDAATQAAVQRWQKDLGVEQNGMIGRGAFVVAPGPVRIQEQTAHVGDRADPAKGLLTVTGTIQLVTVDLDPSKQSMVKVGDRAEIELPDHRRVAGHIATVGTVATAASDDGQNGPDGGDTSSTITVTVALDDPTAAGTLDQAPVSVRLVRSRATDVLAVPVKALLVLKEGGYAVEVARTSSSGGTDLVPVKTGSYADGMVEVTGKLAEGDHVVVAS